MTIKVKKTYELTGRMILDGTRLALENVKVEVRNDDCRLGRQTFITLTILEESKGLVNASIESLKNDTLENNLKDFLWNELEGVITFHQSDLLLYGTKDKPKLKIKGTISLEEFRALFLASN